MGAQPTSRIEVPTDTVLTTATVVPPGDKFHGIFNVERAPAGLTLMFRFGRNGDRIEVPVGAGIVSECDAFADGLFLDTDISVPGGIVVVQIARLGVSDAG